MKETVNSFTKIGAALKAHRMVLICVFFVTLVAVYFLLFLVHDRYTCKMTLVVESELAAETERVITLQQPEHFDLGIVRTDNPINRYAYDEVIKSSQLLMALLGKEVQTLDGTFHGSLASYICGPSSSDVSSPADGVMITPYQARAVNALGKCLQLKINQQSDVITIKVTTKDPLVSAQFADYLKEEMMRFVSSYEQEKMQGTLDKLTTLAAQAEAEWKQAQANGDAQASVRKQVYESFARQQIVYAAQKAALQPTICTISSPVIKYNPSAPHRKIIAILAAILVEVFVGLWYCRREIVEIL